MKRKIKKYRIMYRRLDEYTNEMITDELMTLQTWKKAENVIDMMNSLIKDSFYKKPVYAEVFYE